MAPSFGGEDKKPKVAIFAAFFCDFFTQERANVGSEGGLRELVELELIEISLVATPMQRFARVHAVEG